MNKKIISVACIAAMSLSSFSAFAMDMGEVPFPLNPDPAAGIAGRDFVKTISYFDIFDKYNVTVKTCTNGSVSVDTAKAGYGDIVTVTPHPNNGYMVDEVFQGETKITPDENEVYKFIAGIGDVEVSATFKLIPQATKYNVLIASYDYGTVTADKTEAEENETVTLTVSANDGYKLKSLTASGISPTKVNDTTYTFTMPATDVEIIAVFEEISAPSDQNYTITVADAVGGSATADKSTAAEKDIVTVTVAPNENYTVKSVYANDVLATKSADDPTKYTFEMPAENVTITVEFAAKSDSPSQSYNVTVANAVGGSATVDKATAAEKEIVTITTAPSDGYIVKSVYANDVLATKSEDDPTKYTFEMPSKDVEIKVTFQKTSDDAYILIDSKIKNGTVVADNIKPNANESVTITVTPNAGYQVKTVLVDGKAVTLDKDNEYTFTYSSSPVSVTAEFELADYNITLNVGSNGSAHLEMDGNVYKEKTAHYKDVIYVETDPNSGYVLDEVTVKSGSQKINFSNGRFTMPAGDVKITVSFKKKSGGGGGGSSTNKVYTSNTPTSTAPDTTKTTINVTADNITATASGVLLDSSKTDNGFKIKYITTQFNDYVVLNSSGEVLAKSIFNKSENTIKAISGEGTYSVKQAIGGNFEDVNTNDWFKEYVDFVTARQIMNGTEANKFDPQGTVTRAMVVATLQRIENKNYSNKTTPFADVAQDAWYANAVAWAYENGIVTGVSDNEFDPEAPVTREQLAVILDKYLKLLGVGTSKADLSSFADSANISSWAVDSVANIVGAGIIGGIDGNINASGYATRAEYATMLTRCIKAICK